MICPFRVHLVCIFVINNLVHFSIEVFNSIVFSNSFTKNNMYQVNNFYKLKILSYTYILICVHILNVRSQSASFYSHNTEIFDITTIYKIKELPNINNKDGFIRHRDYAFFRRCGKNCSIEIHSRTNAIGIPIQTNYPILQKNVKELVNKGSFENNINVNISYDSSDFWSLMTINLNGDDCHYTSSASTFYNPHSVLGIQWQNSWCNHALEFRYEKYPAGVIFYNGYEKRNIMSVQWISDGNNSCFTITYVLKINSLMKIKINIKNDNDESIFSTHLEKNNSVQTLKVTELNLTKNQKYKLEMVPDFSEFYLSYGSSTYIDYQRFWFGLLQITQYSNNDESVRTVSMNSTNDFNYPVSFNALGNEENAVSHRVLQQSHCLNGGYLYSAKTQCVCPPGFKGQFCEKGCGSNAYGADCKGVCSMYSKKQCRGMLMCTFYGCACPPGLRGPSCHEDCEFGHFGNDCQQKCSSHCHNNACDQYTGNCTEGCSPGYMPPYCLEKYPFLINPPHLVSNNYDTMELLLNFQSDNIKGGQQNTKLKYYKLLYKKINEDTFRSFDYKLITISENGTTEVLKDLEPDTMYEVGVLVITDDGNLNDEDIVYGQYRTLCISPQNIDYNIKLVSGVKNVNITWKKITPKRFECNVIEYSLILTSDKTHDQFDGVQEIKSSSNNGHFINDLIPGYQYNITLTPKTNYGPLQSSLAYTFSPLMAEEDVKINDIVATTDNEKITITWKLGYSIQNEAMVDKPVTCIVRYKLNRILSCSSKVLLNEWTTVTVDNKTTFEIFDMVPNSQYCIQVLVAIEDGNNIHQENIIYALTPTASPQTEPIFDIEHPMYVTNNSVFFQWKFDQINCSKLNGFFSKFYVELKNKIDSTLSVKETKQNFIVFDGLKSNTPYELKVFIKNHFGYNREHFLLTNFTTKFENLKPVDDLMVYKKSLKNRMVGLRWSYLENTNLDGFIISFNEDDLTNNQSITTIPLRRCSAWPDYYCHTFYHLSPSYNYTFKIKPKSQDYPDGGKVSSISFNSIDGLPDSPNNLKTIEISNTTVTLQWDIPWIFNGVLKSFNINVEEVSAIDMDTCCVSITLTEIPVQDELPAYNYTLTDLKPGSTYSIGVITVSRSLWSSSPARIAVTTLL